MNGGTCQYNLGELGGQSRIISSTILDQLLRCVFICFVDPGSIWTQFQIILDHCWTILVFKNATQQTNMVLNRLPIIILPTLFNYYFGCIRDICQLQVRQGWCAVRNLTLRSEVGGRGVVDFRTQNYDLHRLCRALGSWTLTW